VRNGLAILVSVTVVAACAVPVETSAGITGRLVAGPVCPVETSSPDPACAPYPVANAEVMAVDANGGEYRAVSGADGNFRLSVPAGALTISFPEVEGLIGVPETMSISIAESATIDLGEIAYDTGIR
jgi:hypothetical protein